MRRRPIVLLLPAALLALAASVALRSVAVERTDPAALSPAVLLADERERRRAPEPEPAAEPELRAAAAPLQADAEPAAEGFDELPDFVKKPAIGVHAGPWARASFESGAPRYEGSQVRRADGAWVLDGEWTAWHENGEVQERGVYREHLEHGFWQWWDPEGGPIARGSFADGEREGPWTYWHRDGTKRMEAYYSGGRAEGRWTLYHEDGTPAAQGSFVDGELSGHWTIRFEDGTIDRERTGLYEHGQRVGD